MKTHFVILKIIALVAFFVGVLSGSLGSLPGGITSEQTVSSPLLYGADLTEPRLAEKELRQIERIMPAFEACESREGDALVRCVDNALRQVAAKYGARTGLNVAVALSKKHPILVSYSHDLSHTIGLYALSHEYGVSFFGSLRGDPELTRGELTLVERMGRALVDCYGWGVMGCMHGVIEGAISKIPKEKRTTVVKKACMENPLIGSNQVYRNHCLHWAGHGMAIFTDQSLTQSLAVCEGLDKVFESENVQLCISGIFHSATFPRDFEGKYLDNLSRVYSAQNVYYPCDLVPERFRKQCYNGVPGRSHTTDLSVIFANCHSIPESDADKKFQFVRGCYDAAANILSAHSALDAGEIIDKCRTFSQTKYLPYCYAGALRYWFLRDPSLTNTGPSEICRRIEKEHKPLCYTALGAVVHESYYSADMLDKACAAFSEPEYRNDCLTLREF